MEKRFAFGRNWRSFLSTLNDQRIAEAENSLREMLGRADLKSKTFLDIGSGSGLFSLAARRLGAEVHSFDYDPDSVECARILKSRYFPDDSKWKIEQGSVLDRTFMRSLGQYEIVYSWGVLHHTGRLSEALESAGRAVRDGGQLFIAIYNDQGWRSKFWTVVKRTYCSGPMRKAAMCLLFLPYFFLRAVAASLVKRKNVFAGYKKIRGMSIVHDWFDWLGGYPFEVASLDAIKNFYEPKGFVLQKSVSTQGWGNNEFVFVKKNGA